MLFFLLVLSCLDETLLLQIIVLQCIFTKENLEIVRSIRYKSKLNPLPTAAVKDPKLR